MFGVLGKVYRIAGMPHPRGTICAFRGFPVASDDDEPAEAMAKQGDRRKRSADTERADLEREIRRRFGHPENRRVLRMMPQFSLVPGMPDRFRELLGKLDEAEKHARRGFRSGGSPDAA
ncbi:hypothetical protein [Nitratireductor sp. ZSWI3]|uniref:hypothetical protein n=1 Tax=Nitratireductor sp. ZSWI3 TaxID=2966359 RepID=UPI0021503049|nr:hypothetical protein [Nitratireductor sp. ZSWI3]MCR4268671.1 hypothetical protein [Nitratireductor sp. ZSWI3]